MHDAEHDVSLTEHMQIHTVELAKWKNGLGRDLDLARVRWIRFLTEAAGWEEIPEELKTPELEEAMATLERFHTNASWNRSYLTRLTVAEALAETEAREEAAWAQVEVERAEKERAQARADAAERRIQELEARLRTG